MINGYALDIEDEIREIILGSVRSLQCLSLSSFTSLYLSSFLDIRNEKGRSRSVQLIESNDLDRIASVWINLISFRI